MRTGARTAACDSWMGTARVSRASLTRKRRPCSCPAFPGRLPSSASERWSRPLASRSSQRSRPNSGFAQPEINERFHLDAPGWFRSSEPAPHLLALSTAVWENRRVKVRYARSDGKTVDRDLDPLGLVLKGGIWYVVCGHAGQARTYRVSRMEAVTLCDERFERPDTFDLATFWADATEAYESGIERMDVVVRIRPERREALAEILGSRDAGSVVELDEPDPEGWPHLRVRLEWPLEAHEQLLRLGSDVEVLAPAELRERVVRAARAVLERYRAVS